MAEFTAKPLGILDKIYRFVGGLRSVSEAALETPVQLVHDISRETERATVLPGDVLRQGIAFYEVPNVFAGAATQQASAVINDSAMAAFGVRSTDHDIWIVGFATNVGTTAPSQQEMGIRYVAGMFGLVNNVTRVLQKCTSWLSDGSVSASIPTFLATTHPTLLPWGCYLWTRATSTAAGTIVTAFVLEIVPRGGAPRGMM